jgi:hypothetical protein
MANVYEYKNKKGQIYYLHSKVAKLKNDVKPLIYYFTRDIRPESIPHLPWGYEVVENLKSGLPVLRRKR